MDRRSFVLALPFVLIAAVALAQPEPSACTETLGLVTQLLTPPAGRIPRGGSLVVGLAPGAGTARSLDGALLRRGRRRTLPLRPEALAPGLYKLTPDSERRVRGRFRLEGIGGATDVIFGRGRMPPTPPAPELVGAQRYLRSNAAGTVTEVRGEMRFPVPDSIVAAVLYWGDDDEPDAYVRPQHTARDLLLYGSPAPCTAPIEGASGPAEGSTARVAFVDAYGQLSSASNAVPIR